MPFVRSFEPRPCENPRSKTGNQKSKKEKRIHVLRRTLRGLPQRLPPRRKREESQSPSSLPCSRQSKLDNQKAKKESMFCAGYPEFTTKAQRARRIAKPPPHFPAVANRKSTITNPASHTLHASPSFPQKPQSQIETRQSEIYTASASQRRASKIRSRAIVAPVSSSRFNGWIFEACTIAMSSPASTA